MEESTTSKDLNFKMILTQSDKTEQQEPKVELKQLPQTLRYELLDERSNQPVIVNVILGEFETVQLLIVLKNTRRN